MHISKDAWSEVSEEDFELGFKLKKDHLEVTTHPSSPFDTKNYYRHFNYWDGDSEGYVVDDPIQWSTGTIPSISITKGHLWINSEDGVIALYDATHFLWFIRYIDGFPETRVDDYVNW